MINLEKIKQGKCQSPLSKTPAPAPYFHPEPFFNFLDFRFLSMVKIFCQLYIIIGIYLLWMINTFHFQLYMLYSMAEIDRYLTSNTFHVPFPQLTLILKTKEESSHHKKVLTQVKKIPNAYVVISCNLNVHLNA